MYKKDEKFNAVWCAAIVIVSYELINRVTAEKILVSKKMAKPMGIPIFIIVKHSFNENGMIFLKIMYVLKGWIFITTMVEAIKMSQ